MVATLAAGVVCLTRGPARDAAGCAFASGLLLGSVDVMEYYVGREVARVLADVVLMTPLLFWLHWS
jgi:ABC-type amino acid transport system permease subunit